MKPGQALNDLVHLLERTLVPGAATIEKNKRIPAIGTGQLREFDVLITWKQAHHTLLTGIECRDRSRPVGVPAIEAFATKCDRCGVDHRVIVSATGFTASAYKEAEALSVDLMNLAEAKAVEWHNMQFLIETILEFEAFNSFFHLDGDGEIIDPFKVFDTDGTEVTVEMLQQMLINGYRANHPDGPLDDEADKVTPVHIRANTVDWTIRGSDNKEFRVVCIDADGGFRVKTNLRPLKNYRYGPKGFETEVALADTTLGEFSGSMALVRREDGGVTVRWIPRNPTNQK